MSLNDDIISRWLDDAADDAAPRLEHGSAGVGHSDMAGQESVESEEEERQRRRLRLVQGLLSTLDLRTAPKELDSLVEGLGQDLVLREQGFVVPVHFSAPAETETPEWVDGLADMSAVGDSLELGDPEFKAPAFLDRIVEEHLSSLDDFGAPELDPAVFEAFEASRTHVRWGLAKRLMAGASLVLALVVAPLYVGERVGYFGGASAAGASSLRMVSYDSLEGLQKAFPKQSQVAEGMGMFGAFGGVTR